MRDLLLNLFLMRVELYVICLGVLTCNVYSCGLLNKLYSFVFGSYVQDACVLHFYIVFVQRN